MRAQPQPGTPDAEPNAVRAVSRAIELLNALTDGPQSLGDLARRTNLSKPTAHRLLTTLRTSNAVAQEAENGMYQLGPICFSMFDSVQRTNATITAIAADSLTALRDHTGETVTLNVRVGSYRLCIDERPSVHPIRYVAGIGDQSLLHRGAGGKTIMAWLSTEAQDAILAAAIRTDPTPVDVAKFQRELRLIRRQGYAISRGERVDGVAAISAPIGAGDAPPVAVVTIIGPEHRLTSAKLHGLRDALLASTCQIGRRMSSDRAAS